MRHQVIGCGLIAVTLAAVTTAATVSQDAKATEILAATRKAIGNNRLDSLKTLTVQATMQRNVGNFQSQAEVEMLLEMPDKFVRSDVASGMMNMNIRTGFNGERAIVPAGARALPGGGMVITMGGPGAAAHGMGAEAEKPTPEQLEQMNKASLRNSRQEISRLTLGWFGTVHPSMRAQYTYVGEAESPDGKAYVIEAKDEDGFAARLFIDQNSKLPLMVTYQGRQRQVMTSGAAGPGTPRVTTSGGCTMTRQLTEEEAKKLREQTDKNVADLKTLTSQSAPMVEYLVFFEDWREVDGINFPHVIRRGSKGTTDEEWTISKVKFNAKIDAKKFDTKQ